jgi:hypothetical protein
MSWPTSVGVEPSWVRLCGWLEGPTLGKGIRAVAELDCDNVDDELGAIKLYFCALRYVETPPHSESKFTSARP